MPSRTAVREPFNAFTHLAGAGLVFVMAVVLVISNWGNTMAAVGFAIFGVTATLLFVTSGVYHWGSSEKQWLRRFDHAAIYLMIAGTYTPVCLLSLGEPTKWVVLSLQWILAIIGVSVSLSRDKTPTSLRLTLYLVMGWMVIGVIGDMVLHSGLQPLIWLMAGGLAYTIGAVVYALKKPNPWPKLVGSHGLWHLFVLLGAGCHVGVMLVLTH